MTFSRTTSSQGTQCPPWSSTVPNDPGCSQLRVGIVLLEVRPSKRSIWTTCLFIGPWLRLPMDSFSAIHRLEIHPCSSALERCRLEVVICDAPLLVRLHVHHRMLPITLKATYSKNDDEQATDLYSSLCVDCVVSLWRYTLRLIWSRFSYSPSWRTAADDASSVNNESTIHLPTIHQIGK